MTCKKFTGQTFFRLVYGVETVMPMEYIVPSLRIAVLAGMTDRGALERGLRSWKSSKNGWDSMKRFDRVILGSKNS